jgi:hypothetical protein
MMKVLVVVVLLAVAWAVGFWPERSVRNELETQHEQLKRELAECQQRVRMAAVLGRGLALRDAVMANNFGIAQGLSSPFFDAVSEEAGRAAGTPYQAVLAETLATRDAVTSALTRADPAVQDTVRRIELRLRAALGYATPSEPAPSGPAAPPLATPAPTLAPAPAPTPLATPTATPTPTG